MSILAAQLLFEDRPSLSRGEFLAAVQTVSPQSILLGEGESEGPLSVLHPDKIVTFADGKAIPAQTVLLLADGGPELDRLASAVEQSWDFPDASGALSRSRYSGLLTELMSSPLEPVDRLEAFQRTLDGLLSVLDPVAIHWHSSDRLLNPAEYRRGIPRQNFDALAGAINIRLFNVTGDGGDTGDTLMDSRGLDIFGLPDVQCHFRDLDPGSVAGYLYNVANYIFEQGDVIGDGHTVAGLDPDEKWICRHEESLAGPDRVVLDICPSPPHAAGR